MEWKVGDWVVFNLEIGQIKELRDDGIAAFSDGSFETSGRLTNRFRPLTLRNKSIVETFEVYYNRLHEIDGNSGFNYSDISQFFSRLALDAIDGDEGATKQAFERGQQFVSDARDHKTLIQGIRLFRPALRSARI